LNRADVAIGSIGLMLGIASFLLLPQIFTDCSSAVSQIDGIIPYDLAEKCSMLDSIELTTKILGIDAVGMIQLGTMISVLISLVILVYGAVVTSETKMKKHVPVSEPKTSTTPRISYSKEA
jgi:hypothetical protein